MRTSRQSLALLANGEGSRMFYRPDFKRLPSTDNRFKFQRKITIHSSTEKHFIARSGSVFRPPPSYLECGVAFNPRTDPSVLQLRLDLGVSSLTPIPTSSVNEGP